MTPLQELSERAQDLKTRFVKSYIESMGGSEKIGELWFLYKDTYGLPVETCMDVLYDVIDKEWKKICSDGLEYAKQLEREKYGEKK